MQESEVQAEYDNILREAKLLRMDLQHALTKCLEHRVCSSSTSSPPLLSLDKYDHFHKV